MKVLIVSHNVISRDGSMGRTLCAYFQDWDPAALCQLYFHSEIPTTRVCQQYYQVTDVDLLNALRFRRPGRALTAADIREDRPTARTDTGAAARIYQAGERRRPWMIWGRNALWALGAWKTRALYDWVEAQRPDVIFFASGDYVFSYRVAAHLAEKYRLPLVISVMDDYYFDRGGDRSPLAAWNTRVFRRTMEDMMKAAAGAVYVHPAMQAAYDRAFGTHGRTLYKAEALHESPEPPEPPLRISYLGSLGLNRQAALLDVGRAVKRLTGGTVDVYSAETRPELLRELTAENGICFRGAVSPAEAERVRQESHILLLAESFDPALRGRLRYSLSTKVPEYLASGRCMAAYGPEEAGSISYLRREGGLCVAASPAELEERLREVLFSPQRRQAYVQAQRTLAERNHSAAGNAAALRAVLEQAAKEGRR